jgi:hypothetical protein
MKALFATAKPPAVVMVPPFVALVASVVLEIPRPPRSLTAPVELLTVGVVSSKITEPLVALEVDRMVVLLPEFIPPVII